MKKAPPSVDKLLQIGFIDFAEWQTTQKNNVISYKIDSSSNKALEESRNVLYAFCINENVMYIGKTTRGIKKRFVGYCKPGKTQQTNRRCHEKIKETLAKNDSVRIYVFSPISQLQYGDFEINIAAGLEDSLINIFHPEWNSRKGSRPLSEEEEREIKEESEDAILTKDTKNIETLPEHGVSFEVPLKETYYNYGTINPGKSMNQYLGEHDTQIIVYLGNKDEFITSKINKTANKSGAVRIVGNNHHIARWFQENFELGDTVSARIIDPHHIILMLPA